MAIAFVADGGYAHSTGTLTLTKPTGTAQNNLMLMFVNVQHNGSIGTVTTLSGWTYGTDTAGSVDSTTFWNRMYVLWKIAGASEPSSYGVTTSDLSDGVIRTYSGTDTTAPINSFQVRAETTTTSSPVVPAFSETFNSGEWYVGCSSTDTNLTPTGGAASPTLSNAVSDGGFYTSFYRGNYAPAGIPGTETYTYASSVKGAQAIGVTIRPPRSLVFSPSLRQYLRR